MDSLTPQQIVANAHWIVAVPFLAGLLIILLTYVQDSFLKPKMTKVLAMTLSIGAVVYGFAHSILILKALVSEPLLAPYVRNVDWFVSDNLKLSIGLLVDNMATIMLLVVTCVSTLVQVYTHGYMREDKSYSRFYAYLSLFTGSMLGLVVSTNLFQMFFFWELVGVCSYFLIGFWWHKDSAAAACVKAFVVNRIGDCGFLIGILMLLYVTRDCWGDTPVLSFFGHPGLADVIKTAHLSYGMTEQTLTVISLFILLGPIAKSAQFPLHVWLPDAMEGPTPISALIHAATMVAAGVYLVARAYPLWLTPDGSTHSTGLAVVAWVGGFTAFMAATIALTQFDIKRALAWSTVSQLGYMFVGLGSGALSGGMFHLFTHAFFKAMLFLCSGAVIHGLHGQQDMRKMGGLLKSMPITGYCFLIGTLAISGCPGFAGFFSKDEVIAASCHFNPFLGGVMILTAALTAFYMFRMYFLTFTGAYRGDAHPHESPPAMTMPLCVLAVPSIVAGYLGFNPAALGEIGKLLSGQEGTAFPSWWGSFVYQGAHPEFEGLNGMIMMASIAAAGAGFVISYMTYVSKSIDFNTKVVESKDPTVQWFYQLSFNKWHWDTVYMFILQKVILPGFKWIWTKIDVHIVNQIVDLSGMVTVGCGEILRYTQNGRSQYYALVIFGWVAGLTFLSYYIFLRP